jgi:hypothetical protein
MYKIIAIIGFSLIIAMSTALESKAELATEREMENVANNWISTSVSGLGDWAGVDNPAIASSSELRSEDGLLLATIYHIKPAGFIAVPVLKEISPVKMYSDVSDFDVNATEGIVQILRDVLVSYYDAYGMIYGSLDSVQASGEKAMFGSEPKAAWQQYSVEPRHFAGTALSGETMDEGEVLIETDWDQGSPYNNFCPKYNGVSTRAGCVAIAMAQIMRYHEWPPSSYTAGAPIIGTSWDGTYVYNNDCVPVTKPPEWISAIINDPYDWDNMPNSLDIYHGPVEKAALAELCFEVGVAVNMDWGVCSGADIPDFAPAFVHAFGYKSTIDWEYRSEEGPNPLLWYNKIKVEIDAGRPIFYTIPRHAIVCDGYQQTGSTLWYHMNYGWGRYADPGTTWYALDHLYCKG